MKVLTINSGSSSVKFQLFDLSTSSTVASGVLERIGEHNGQQSYALHNSAQQVEKTTDTLPLANHQEGLKQMAAWLTESRALKNPEELIGIGHRVAHGGANFSEPTVVTPQVLEAIRQQIPLAPLHNPANLLGIEVAMEQWPQTAQVAIFDTAFHQTIPAHAHLYAIPAQFAHEHHLRRYGFHGTSHKYVTQQAAERLEKPLDQVSLISLHLGNGASAAAIQNGQSIDTSMGLTPLEGLVMGTRCGDLDPGIVLHLAQSTGLTVEQIDTLLNKESGLKGICGSNDMREVLARADQDDLDAKLAVSIYCYRIKKYIGAYAALLPSLDAVVFTAGIGEHAPQIRALSCKNLDHLGISIDQEKNNLKTSGPYTISTDSSKVKVFIIPTNEELEMAQQTLACLNS